MSETWYVLQDGVAQGPLDLAAMRGRIAAGSLRPDSQVCRVGAQAWGWADADEMLRPLLVGGAPFVQPSVSWSFERAFELARAWRGPSWGLLVAIGLTWFLAFLPSVGFGVMAELGREMQEEPSLQALDGLNLLVQLVTRLLVQVPLQASVAVIGAAAIRGDLRYTDMFVAFRRFFGVLGASIIYGLAVSAALLITMLPMFALPLIAFSGGFRATSSSPIMFFLIALAAAVLIGALMIRWVIRYSLGVSIVCDPVHRSVGIFEAFRMSAAVMRGREGSVFLFMMVTTLLAVLSVLLLGVGILLVGWPLWVCANGAIYHLLVRSRPVPGPSPGA
jgi:hypothetical protein